MADKWVHADRRVWSHPIFIAGFLLAAVAITLLPLQYIPVLWRFDREFMALGLTPMVIGTIIASTRRQEGAVRSAVISAAGLLFAATIGYRLYDGIGLPDPFDIVIILALVAAPVWAMVTFVRTGPGILVVPVAAVLSSSSIFAFGLLAADPGDPKGPANHCEVRDDIQFCYFARFGSFVDLWAPAVLGVVRQLPDNVRANVTSVVQTVDRPLRGKLATPFLDWDRPNAGTAELALALDVANSALGINDEFKGLVGTEGRLCTPRLDDGRIIVAFWLAGQATIEGGKTLRALNKNADAITGSEYAAPVIGSMDSADDAIRLLNRPVTAVAILVREHWNALSNPLVTVREVRALLELPPSLETVSPESSDERFYTQDCE